MSPPFSTPVPDEFVPRDAPAPSRISTTFLPPRCRAIVKSKQTPLRVAGCFRPSQGQGRSAFPTLSSQLDYRASPFTSTFIPYDRLAPLLPYSSRVFRRLYYSLSSWFSLLLSLENKISWFSTRFIIRPEGKSWFFIRPYSARLVTFL